VSRRKRRPKSEGELRAEVEMLYDEHVLPGKLAQLRAEGIIADACEHLRERECSRHRAGSCGRQAGFLVSFLI
jgi:hypothetical protein